MPHAKHPSSIGEKELLALVEGTLDARSAERILEALGKKDRRLVEQIRSMSSDRAVLRDLLAGDVASAPGGLVQDAIAIAEREGLLVERPRVHSSAPGRRLGMPTSLAAAISLALAAGIIGGGAAVLVSVFGDRDELADESQPGGLFEAPDPEGADSEDLELASELLPDVLMPQTSPDIGADEQSNMLLAGTDGAGPLPPAESEALDATDLLPGPLAESTPAAEASMLPLERAARLALAGRLELVVPARDPDEWASGAERTLARRVDPVADQRADRRATPRGAIRSLSVELTVPWDPDLAALQDELRRLRRRAQLRAGAMEPEFRSISLPIASDSSTADADADAQLLGTLPSREVQHVLWWTQPTSSWRRYISVRILVHVIEAEE